jgi:hypothetical protein
MKTVRMSRVLASIVGAASLVLMIPVSLSATSEWEVFYIGESNTVCESCLPATGDEGKGFDAFNSGDGVKVDDFHKAYIGTSMGSQASGGWDVFRIGDGDPLP